MTVAQGIKKQVAYKKQSGLGTPVSGSGGQLIRRETFTMNATKDTYSNNEIVSHQQHTGDVHGVRRSAGSLSGVLSPKTYQDWFSSLLRKAWAATSAITGLSLTIAASGSGYTITRGSGDFLADGLKIGDVIRITAGSFTAGTTNKNLLVTGLTATVATVLVLNGSTLTAEGPVASATITVPGKKVWVPTSGHTNDYYGIEEWFSDLSRSHLNNDVQIGSTEISLPATGNVAANWSLIGLGDVDKSGSQVLTSPTAETTTGVVASVSGAMLVDGVKQAAITSVRLTIDGQTTHGEAVIGSNSIPDTQRGKVRVSGTFTALYESDTLGTPFDDESAIELHVVAADSQLAAADFVSFSMTRVKVFSNDADDGEKQIVRTYNFTAEINGSGGAGTAYDQTIIAIQDSQATA